MTQEVEKLGRRIAQLEDALNSLLRNGIGLGRSSFDDGAIQQYTDGTLGSSFGTQYDGSNGIVALNGPKPPTPAAPEVEPVLNGLLVRVTGEWLGGGTTVAPLDFSHWEIHVGPAGMSGLLFETLKGQVVSARGGEFTIPVGDTDEYVLIRARTTSGRLSDPSPTVGPYRGLKLSPNDLDIDLTAIQGSQLFWGDTQPTTDKIGDLWLQLPAEVAWRYEGETLGWDQVTDQESVVAAMKDAIGDKLTTDGQVTLTSGDAVTMVAHARDLAAAAQAAAEAASDDAAAAAGLASLAKNTADSAVVVYRQTSMPTGGAYGLNDLWIDTSPTGGNKLYAWTGGAWSLVDDQRIATALSTAQGKTTVFAQTSAPSTTGRTVGDQWIDTDDGNKVYVWTGSWTATLFGATALSATARQLGAFTIYKQGSAPSAGVLDGDYWIDDSPTGGNKSYVRVGGAWVAVQDVAIQTALTNASTAQGTANSKIIVFAQISAPPTTGRTVGDVWIDTDDSNVTYTWSGTAWTKRQISSGAIAPNSLVAKDVIATGTISAALLETILILANTIVLGTPTGNRIQITAAGIQQIKDGNVTFNLDSTGGAYFAGTLTGRSTNFTEGTTGWRLEEDGDATFQTMQVYDTFNAKKASVTSLDIGGISIQSLIDAKPRGLVAAGFDNTVILGPVTSETGIVELGFTAYPGRSYAVHIKGGAYATDDADTYGSFALRATTDGSPPSVSSPFITLLNDQTQPKSAAGGDWPWRQLNFNYLFFPTVTNPAGQQVRLLLTLAKVRGPSASAVGINNQKTQLDFWIEDIGPIMTNSIRVNNSTVVAPPPPPPAPAQNYDMWFSATWSASYRADGSRWSEGDKMYQGYGDSFNGNQVSMIGFDWQAIRNTVAGGFITSATLQIHNWHTWDYSGGTAYIGSHNALSMPATYPGGIERRYAYSTSKGGWLSVNIATIVQDIAINANQTGVLLGRAPDNNNSNYGYWYGANYGADRPSIRIQWVK